MRAYFHVLIPQLIIICTRDDYKFFTPTNNYLHTYSLSYFSTPIIYYLYACLLPYCNTSTNHYLYACSLSYFNTPIIVICMRVIYRHIVKRQLYKYVCSLSFLHLVTLLIYRRLCTWLQSYFNTPFTNRQIACGCSWTFKCTSINMKYLL